MFTSAPVLMKGQNTHESEQETPTRQAQMYAQTLTVTQTCKHDRSCLYEPDEKQVLIGLCFNS